MNGAQEISLPAARIRGRAPIPRTAGVIVALGMLVTACATTRPDVESATDVPLPPDLPNCSEQFEDGKVITDGAEGDFSKACVDGDELRVPVPVRLTCNDDRVLMFNDFAWGYRDEEMTLFDHDDLTRLPPHGLAVECLKTEGKTLDELAEEARERHERATADDIDEVG